MKAGKQIDEWVHEEGEEIKDREREKDQTP